MSVCLLVGYMDSVELEGGGGVKVFQAPSFTGQGTDGVRFSARDWVDSSPGRSYFDFQHLNSFL